MISFPVFLSCMFNAPYVFDVVDKIFSNANKQLFIIVNLKKK